MARTPQKKSVERRKLAGRGPEAPYASGHRAEALAAAIAATGTASHVDRLIDLIVASLPHDRVTVVRYSVSLRPEFVTHRNYSDAMVKKYLETYYVYDPFYAHWRNTGTPGVLSLTATGDARRGPYIAEFLGQSVISDEVGVLLPDGEGWCLGIFLDKSSGRFAKHDIEALKSLYPVFAALHAKDLSARKDGFRRTGQKGVPGAEPALGAADLPDGLWPALSARERDVVRLILAGHPTAGIARKLAVATGTVKNHRRNIYRKLDITSERELFLQRMDFAG